MAIPPLESRITYDEVQAATKHYGRNKNVDALFKTLLGLNAFQDKTAKAIALRCIYAVEKEHIQNNREWGDYRFERLRNGRSSATEREAKYFHDAFAHVFTKEWADLISLEKLMTTPINTIILELQRRHPLKISDPSQLALILSASDTSTDISFQLKADDYRWGDHGEDNTVSIASEIDELKANSYFSLTLTGTISNQSCLIFQIADEALMIQDKKIRGQYITPVSIDSNQINVGSHLGELIKVSPIPGRFHYLAVLSNEAIEPPCEFLSEVMLCRLLDSIWQKKLAGEDVKTALTSYRVLT